MDSTRRGAFISPSHVQVLSAMEPHNGGFSRKAMHGSGLSEFCQESVGMSDFRATPKHAEQVRRQDPAADGP